ncbi:MAG: diaminopimelate epimerase [Phycisphaerales bacterium]
MRFTKMHGCANDYLFVEAFDARDERPDWSTLARDISDRRRAVGADGLIVLSAPTDSASSKDAAFRMRIWNADGSPGEMCGNGLRCAVRLALDKGRAKADEHNSLLVETGAGLLRASFTQSPNGLIDSVSVDMGEYRLGPRAVGMNESITPARDNRADINNLQGILVSVGNPHFVHFTDEDVNALDVARLGRAIETHPAFPNRINAHFVNILSPSELRARTWERGAGLTEACGTGACAIVAAGVAANRLDPHVTVHMPGGALTITCRDNRVTLQGPAEYVGEGTWYGGVPADAPTSPTLTRDGVTLRPLRDADIDVLHESMQEFAAIDNMRTPPWPYLWGEAARWLIRLRRLHALGDASVFGIEVDGALAGTAGLSFDRPMRRAELGYTVMPAFRGRGLATKAAQILLDHAFEAHPLNRVYAEHFTTNPASGRVLEKAGMHREGVLPANVWRFGTTRDVVLFGLTREQWLAQRNQTVTQGND